MSSINFQLCFSNEIREKVDAQTCSLMDVFEKSQAHLWSAIDQQTEHYSNIDRDDIRERHNVLIKAILSSTSAKYVSLSVAMIESVNKYDFLSYALAARSIIEIVATLRHFVVNKCAPIIHEMASSSEYTAAQVQQLLTHEEKYFRGTRFDWVEFFENGFSPLNKRYAEWLIEKKKDKKANKWRPGRTPPLEQTSVTTCLEKWAEDEAGVGVLYDLFCDLVHPNIGSVMSTMVHVGDEVRFRIRDPSSEGLMLFQKSFPAFQVLTGREHMKLNRVLLGLFLPIEATSSERLH